MADYNEKLNDNLKNDSNNDLNNNLNNDSNNNSNEQSGEGWKKETGQEKRHMEKREKNQNIQLSRHIIQLISFFLFPGLFITIFHSMKDIVEAVAKGNTNFVELSPQIILTAGVLLITIFLGRFFCGYMCAFGALSDLIYSAFERIMPQKAKLPKKADRYLKWIKYGVLVFLVIGVWIFAVPVDMSFSPWNAFGGLVSGNINVMVSVLGTVGFFLLLAILIGSIFIERFFCRYLCPLGAVFTPVSKKRLFRIRKKEGGCNSCENCTRKCSMGIEVHGKEKVTSGECIDCMKCISSCPNESLETNPAPVAVGLAAAVAITGLVGVERISQNGYQPEMTAKADYKNGNSRDKDFGRHDFKNGNSWDKDFGKHDFKDGNFRDDENKKFDHDFGNEEDGNSGHGFKGKDKNFKGGPENENDENSGYGFKGKDKNFKGGPGNENDENSGHGFKGKDKNFKGGSENENDENSSHSFKGKDKNFKNDSNNTRPEGPENSENGKSDEKNNESGKSQNQNQESKKIDLSKISDGDYTGTGSGFRGDIKVKVTVKNHKIENITIESANDDREFLNRASTGVIEEILSSQSTEVDAVSGATFSSNGILEAVKNALS